MAIANYTTSVSSEKSIMEIQKDLVKHGATKIITDYEGTRASGVSFTLIVNGPMVAFALPANFRGVLKAMEKDRSVARRLCTEDQASRVCWRILKDWIRAQMAIIESEVADMAEVFLPYAVMESGKTLYHSLEESGIKLLKS